MIARLSISLACIVAILPAAASAEASADFRAGALQNRPGSELPPYLQCVPYARETSGVRIYGDAHTWWDQAAGKYQRGNTPRVGAVLAFRPHRNMVLGHVATVAQVVDARTVKLDHANWSPINGRRGQIERNVHAVDVSPDNDWSAVRVWYHPLQALGKTAWPVHGFIYGEGAAKGGDRWAAARTVIPNPSKQFLAAFDGLSDKPGKVTKPAVKKVRRAQSVAPVTAPKQDRFAAVLAKYDQ